MVVLEIIEERIAESTVGSEFDKLENEEEFTNDIINSKLKLLIEELYDNYKKMKIPIQIVMNIQKI